MQADNTPTETQRDVFTILAAAALVDGEFRPLESAELDALMRRCRTFRSLDGPARDEMRKDIVRHVRKSLEADDTRDDRVVDACIRLRRTSHGHDVSGVCRAVLLHALDLVHADDHLTPSARRSASGMHPKEARFIELLKYLLIDAPDNALEQRPIVPPPIAWRQFRENELMALKNAI
ncbi:MAG: hypothetical protein AB7Q23_15405 [Hyphomonadaceae bacterium]